MGESVSSISSHLEKTDGIEGVPSCKEKLSAFLALKQSGKRTQVRTKFVGWIKFRALSKGN